VTADLLRELYEYFKIAGGLCALCKYCRRVLADGSVDCEKYLLTKVALRCRDYEPRERRETAKYGTTD
jgi:hypothetical protein